MRLPPRFPLAHLPTPLDPLPHLSADLGVDLWVKRDDQTGLALGGNKTRKLEYFLAEALATGADTILTTGAPQSNHCRQTAAAAALAGLRAVLVLAGSGHREITGNILLDHLLGAELIFADTDQPGHAQPRGQALQAAADRERAAGRTPYTIPLGGSNALGAVGYVAAMHELAEQLTARDLPPFDYIVFASSSGGTHAGMALGAAHLGWPTQVLGISVDAEKLALTGGVAEIANACGDLLGLPTRLTPTDIHATADYLGGGYAVLGDAEKHAIHTFARRAALLLDPVYTGRAAAGLLDLIHKQVIAPGSRVLFWHTGGAPALFAYNAALL